MNRRVVGDMLDVAGATMTGAESAELGLKLIDENEYAIVLIDLRMPGMDGITAIRHIRARHDAKAGLPIIVVTADTAVDLRERCIRTGCRRGPVQAGRDGRAVRRDGAHARQGRRRRDDRVSPPRSPSVYFDASPV